jgi:hypothetical protein
VIEGRVGEEEGQWVKVVKLVTLELTWSSGVKKGNVCR